jgi:hypothetical protein
MNTREQILAKIEKSSLILDRVTGKIYQYAGYTDFDNLVLQILNGTESISLQTQWIGQDIKGYVMMRNSDGDSELVKLACLVLYDRCSVF